MITSQQLSEIAIQGLQEKKGVNIVRMNLKDVKGAVTDYFVIATGTSDRHAQALAVAAEDMIRKLNDDERPLHREGERAGEWVLLDYVNVVVHVFLEAKREFYNIEELWGDAVIERFD